MRFCWTQITTKATIYPPRSWSLSAKQCAVKKEVTYVTNITSTEFNRQLWNFWWKLSHLTSWHFCHRSSKYKSGRAKINAIKRSCSNILNSKYPFYNLPKACLISVLRLSSLFKIMCFCVKLTSLMMPKCWNRLSE